MTRLFGFVLCVLVFTACNQADPSPIPTEEPTAVAQIKEIQPKTTTEIALTPISTAEVVNKPAVIAADTAEPTAAEAEMIQPSPTVEMTYTPAVEAEETVGWPMFRLSRNHTGSRGQGFAGSPILKWQFTKGDIVESSPAVVDGIVYIGSGDSNLYALDGATGRLHWRTSLGGGILSSQAVEGELLVVGSNDGRLYGLQRADGAILWDFNIQERTPVWTSPAIVDGITCFWAHDGGVYALEGQECSILPF